MTIRLMVLVLLISLLLQSKVVFAQETPVTQTPTPFTVTPVAEATASAEQLVLPDDVYLSPDQAVLRYLLQNHFLNPLANNHFYPDTAISKADFISLLYRATGLKTAFISEFPYFRDVPLNHWAYFAIESLRMRNMLGGDGNGYFHPDEAISRLEAATLISKSLVPSWLVLSADETEDVFKIYQLKPTDIAPWAKTHLARSIYAGFLLPTNENGAFSLHLEAPLSRMDAARMVYRRALIAAETHPALKTATPWLPANLQFSISPTTTILKQNFEVGEPLYFYLPQPFQNETLNILFPAGTRFSGKVIEVALDGMSGQVRFDKASLPSGESYNINAHVGLQFEEDKNKQYAIVPGQLYQIVTRSPGP